MKSNITRSLILVVSLSVLVLLVACVPAATPAPASANSITGIVWQWTTVTDQGKTTTIPNPEDYTIVFNTDGTLNGKADCNSFTGVYTQESGGFTIKLGASTMAFCGEASLDLQYTQLLSNVAAGGPDGAGGLALETAGGAQRMVFENGGAAPK
ncbi:MAG: META domain-containing protein [Chloroflexi bacterium]|nr:META domain-containing protein [Chloroflexota bacterium]